MLNIPNVIKQLFERDDIRKNFRVHFPNGEFDDLTNENIVEESVTFTESVCSQNVFRFGTAEAAALEFETVGIPNILGANIDAGIEIDATILTPAQIAEIQAGDYDGALVLADASDIGYSFYHVPYGRFRVTNCPRNHQDMARRQITAISDAVKQFSFAPAPMNINYSSLKSMITAVTDDRRERVNYTPTYNDTLEISKGLYIGRPTGTGGYLLAGRRIDEDVLQPVIEWKTFRIPLNLEALEMSREAVVWVEYEDETFDNIAAECFEQFAKTADSLPSTFLSKYDIDGDLVWAYGQPVHENSTGLGIMTGKFQPFYYFDIYDYADDSRWRTMPQFLKANEPTIVNVYNQVSAPTRKAIGEYRKPNQYTIEYLTIKIPYKIAGSASGNNIFSEVRYYSEYSGTIDTVMNTFTPSEWPIANDLERRNSANIKCYATLLPYATYDESFELKTEMTEVKELSYIGEYFTPKADEDKLTTSVLELTGQQAKKDRLTNLTKVINLTESPQINITPAMYDELWWDDFEVEPIGDVNYKYNDVDITAKISTGLSRYDMSDNIILKGMINAETADSAIRNRFAPNASVINFSPIDLTMRGCPWVEAGDRLGITSNDGETLTSYVLRQTLSGIQHLTTTIEATSGETIGITEG